MAPQGRARLGQGLRRALSKWLLLFIGEVIPPKISETASFTESVVGIVSRGHTLLKRAPGTQLSDKTLPRRRVPKACGRTLRKVGTTTTVMLSVCRQQKVNPSHARLPRCQDLAQVETVSIYVIRRRRHLKCACVLGTPVPPHRLRCRWNKCI